VRERERERREWRESQIEGERVRERSWLSMMDLHVVVLSAAALPYCWRWWHVREPYSTLYEFLLGVY